MKAQQTILFVIILILFNISNLESYSIKCKINGCPDNTKFYLMKLSGDEYLDSAIIINNNFVMNGKSDKEPELFIITTELIGQHYNSFYLGNEKIQIEGDIKYFPKNLKISGSKTQDESEELNRMTNSLYEKRMKLLSEYSSLPDKDNNPLGKVIWDTIAVIDKKYTETTIDFIKKHKNSFISIIHLNYELKNIPKVQLKEIFNKLSPELKSSKYAKPLKIYLFDKIYDKGDKFLDFEAYNLHNKKVRLSDFSGGYILLDFTSLSCVPCKLSVKELKRIFTAYKEKLRIVSFSVDSKKSDLLKSFKRDSVKWESLWDGGGWKSETCMKYSVTSVPTFVLIGPDNTIVDKWTGYGEGRIENKIKNYIK
ncbi:MAG: alkyl hydroperoxide reductase/thiol specific antioxidant/mal allergen [Ignavibacteria bacterium]|nr:alkyl hydroperoxide reductase/thiol specific antioxidant/mal allergen [Ignavibacteria bacterium]